MALSVFTQSLSLPALARLSDGCNKLMKLDRLGQVTLETCCQGAFFILFFRIRRDRNGGNWRSSVERDHFLEQLVSVFTRHGDIRNQDIGPVRLNRLNSCR